MIFKLIKYSSRKGEIVQFFKILLFPPTPGKEETAARLGKEKVIKPHILPKQICWIKRAHRSLEVVAREPDFEPGASDNQKHKVQSFPRQVEQQWGQHHVLREAVAALPERGTDGFQSQRPWWRHCGLCGWRCSALTERSSYNIFHNSMCYPSSFFHFIICANFHSILCISTLL